MPASLWCIEIAGIIAAMFLIRLHYRREQAWLTRLEMRCNLPVVYNLDVNELLYTHSKVLVLTTLMDLYGKSRWQYRVIFNAWASLTAVIRYPDAHNAGGYSMWDNLILNRWFDQGSLEADLGMQLLQVLRVNILIEHDLNESAVQGTALGKVLDRILLNLDSGMYDRAIFLMLQRGADNDRHQNSVSPDADTNK
jgi:hypothetical protein